MAKARTETFKINFKAIDDSCFNPLTVNRGTKVRDVARPGQYVIYVNGNVATGDMELHAGDSIQEMALEGKAGA